MTDWELIKQVRNGTKVERDIAFETLAHRHKGLLTKLCRQYADHVLDFDDLHQHALLALLRCCEQYDHERSVKLSTLLHTAVTNVLLQQHEATRSTRSPLRRLNSIDAPIDGHDTAACLLAAKATPDTTSQTDWLVVAKDRLRRVLTPNQIEALRLWIRGATFSEIGNEMGVSKQRAEQLVSTVKHKAQKIAAEMDGRTDEREGMEQ